MKSYGQNRIMLLRVGRIVYLCIFALLVLMWTGVHDDDTKQVMHKGWSMTTHAFGQGSSFATDGATVFDSGKARSHVDTSLGVVQKQRMMLMKV